VRLKCGNCVKVFGCILLAVPVIGLSVKYVLGIIIDHGLTFETQCSKAVANAFSVIGVIRRTFTFLDEKTLIRLYKSMVRPILEFAVQVWSPSAVGLMGRLRTCSALGDQGDSQSRL